MGQQLIKAVCTYLSLSTMRIYTLCVCGERGRGGSVSVCSLVTVDTKYWILS